MSAPDSHIYSNYMFDSIKSHIEWLNLVPFRSVCTVTAAQWNHLTSQFPGLISSSNSTRKPSVPCTLNNLLLYCWSIHPVSLNCCRPYALQGLELGLGLLVATSGNLSSQWKKTAESQWLGCCFISKRTSTSQGHPHVDKVLYATGFISCKLSAYDF